MPSPDQPIPQAQTPSKRSLHRNRRFATPRTIFALMLREVSTRYGDTPGGYLWAVVEPLGMILTLSIAFSLLLRAPSLGESFILFYATAYLPFSLFQNLSNTILRALNFSKPLLQYPAVTWIDAVLARFFLNTLTSVFVSYVMLVVILIFTDTRNVLLMPNIIGAFVLAMVMGLGVGVLNCALRGLFNAWDNIWSIFTRPLFLASAIFYIVEDLPRFTQDILWYNPLVHITGLSRTGFYLTYAPDYISIPYVLFFSLICLVLGLLLLGRFHRDILNR